MRILHICNSINTISHVSNFGNFSINLMGQVIFFLFIENIYEGWNFNSGNYLFTTDTK